MEYGCGGVGKEDDGGSSDYQHSQSTINAHKSPAVKGEQEGEGEEALRNRTENQFIIKHTTEENCYYHISKIIVL